MNFVNAGVVKDLLLELDLDISIQEQPDFYNTALVLLSAPICGPDADRLAKFTGLPRAFIALIRLRMIEAELWTSTDIRCDEWYSADGRLSTKCFCLDVLVAEGLVRRVWSETQGQYCYGYHPDLTERVN